MLSSFGNVCGSKVVMTEKDTDVGGVGVKEAGIREGGKHVGVDRWMVRGSF